MADERIGGAWFGLSVNSDEFAAQMKTAENTAVRSTENIDSGVVKTVNSFKTLSLQVLSAVGVFGTLYSVGQQIRKLFQDLTEENERFLQSIQSRGPEERLRAIADELQTLQNAMSGNDFDNLLQGQTTAQVRQRIEQLEAERTALSLVASGERADQEQKIAEDQYKRDLAAYQAYQKRKADLSMSLAEQLFGLRIAAESDESKRIQMETDAALERAERQFDSLGSDKLGTLQDAIIADRDRKLFDLAMKREKEEMESNRRIAADRLKLELDNIKRAEDYRRSLTQGFGVGDVATTDLGSLTRAIQDLASTQIQTRD